MKTVPFYNEVLEVEALSVRVLLEIVRVLLSCALIKKARLMGVEFLVNHYVMDITKIENYVSGVVTLNVSIPTVVVYPAKAVVFAGGGYAGIYRGFSTNAQDCTGDMLSVALRAGLSLKDMEFVQFHPTGFAKTSYLISEAARGEGGHLVNSDGERFVDELDARCIISCAIFEQVRKGKKSLSGYAPHPQNHFRNQSSHTV